MTPALARRRRTSSGVGARSARAPSMRQRRGEATVQDQQDELEFRVLRSIQDRALTLNAIASELLLPPSRVQRVLESLIARALVRKEERPGQPVIFRVDDRELRNRVAA